MKEKNNNYKHLSTIKNYTGYSNNHNTKIDELISLIKAQTSCGEFFRRYWHPFALTSEVGDKPSIDVFLPEPIAQDDDLWNVPNLIITPHISADDSDSYIPQTLDLFFQTFQNFILEKPLVNLVNKKLGY